MKDACKVFTERRVLDHADFGLEEGEKVGVIGVNGTGKSSLLRILAGEEELDEGSIVMGGAVKVAFLSQNPVITQGVTILEYVMETAHEGEAKAMLNRLGFEDVSIKTDTLSGGQKKKVALARVLLTPCEILILDEPTNHLDQKMVRWLEDYLTDYRGCLVMVTHDRYFLDRVTNRIVEVNDGKLYSYKTNYEGFIELKAQREEMELATYNKSQNILRKELAWLMRGARARSTKQKAHIQRIEERQKMTAPKEQLDVEIRSASTRMGKKTLELRDIRKCFGDRVIIDGFSYIFLAGDRVGIIGDNGCGKSTLMNIIAGTLQADEGVRDIGSTVKIGYFSQENERLDPSERVIDYIKDTAEYVRIDGELISASVMLERFLFDKVLQYQKIEKLSGGEKRRLYLLKVLMEAPNLLLLDEPTNDLDIQTLQILEDYLDSFEGIVVTVSHDRYFLDRIVRRIFAFEDGTINQYEGGYSDYEAVTDEKEAATEVKEAPAREKNYKEKAPAKLKFTYKEQKEFETIEDDIASIEEKIAALDEDILKNARDFVKLSELTKEKEEAESLLEEKMERYIYLSELNEKILAQ